MGNISLLTGRWLKTELAGAPANMWRYHPVLPAKSEEAISLNEGWTPLFEARSLGKAIGAAELWVKDDSRNPTGSSEARAASAIVTMAKKSGIDDLSFACNSDQGSALAAYAALAGLPIRLIMPANISQASFLECKAYGARVELTDRSGDTLPEADSFSKPFRIEGLKTAGYEIAEQMGWKLPDAVICPGADPSSLAAISKAFLELQQLGWVEERRTKLIAAEPTGNPLAAEWTGVPVSREEMLDETLLLARSEGVFAAPEGGACVAVARRLLATGFLSAADRIVLYNPSSGLRRTEAFSTRFLRREASEQDKLGGLILPR